MREKKPKRVKGGLVPDENLSVVTSAGFKAEKRVRSINRRAGLHDKKKNLTGEKRVSRRKPLALKHVRRMRKAAAALSAVFVGAIAFVGYGFIFKKPVVPLGDGGYETICLELPADGAKPTSHTAVECVGYMNYALKHQQSWSSEFHATVNAMGLMSQSVSTYKEYYDSVLVSADLTTSSMVNNARQFCVADGRVIWREASGGKNTYAAMDTPWSEKLAGNYTLAEFKDKRGFPPTEFSVYVINEKTVLEEGTSEYAVDNGDGTYSVTLHLNCVSPQAGNEEVNETSAVYYYVRQMVVTGGLSDYPVFKDVKITYTFDESWRVLSSEVSEDYTAVMGVSAGCSSDSLTEYFYDTAEQAKSTVEKYYDGFFKQHMATEVTPDDGAITSATCLSNAFGSVLTEGAIFKVGLKVDGLNLNGVVALDMVDGAIGDVRVKFGDTKAYYGVYDGKNALYISVGRSKIMLNIDDLSLGSSDGGLLDGLDTDALLEQLGGGDFALGDDGTKATLSSKVEVFGLKISLLFTFNIDGKDVALDNLAATIPLGEKVISASLQFGTEEDKPAALSDGERAEYIDVINDGFTVRGNANLSVGGVNIALDINELSVKLTNGVSFKLGAKLIAADRVFDIYASYENGKVTAVYGDSENNLGVTLNINDGDLNALSTAISDVIERIRSVIDEIVKGGNSADEELTSVESELETAGGLADVLSQVLGILGIPVNESGDVDILALINSIDITTVDGKAVVCVGENLALTLGIDENAVGFGFEIANASAAFALENLRLTAYTDVDCPATEDSLVTADGLVEILDYVAATAELLVEDEFSVSANVGTFEDNGSGYEKTADIDIVLERAGDTYFRFAVSLDNYDEAKDDLYLDLYILENSAAGGLDVYLTASKYAVGAENYEPLKVYATMDEILTVLASGAALLNLQGVDVSEVSARLQSVIDTLGNLLDEVLIKSKLPYTHSQFSSLGASLIPQFLGKDLSSFLKDVLTSLSMDGGEEEEETPAICDGNFINGVRLGEADGNTELSIELNSAAIYGGGFENIIFKAYKANHKITGAGLNNVYYGGNKRLDLGLNVLREVEKTEDFSGYYDLRGIDTLLCALVNSATHPKENATDLDKLIYGTQQMPDYLLNRYYYVNGHLTAELSIIDIISPVIELDLVAVSVTIDENNSVAVNARLHYDGLIASALGTDVIAINGESYVDLTIKDGKLYIKRTELSRFEVGRGTLVSGIAGAAGYDFDVAKDTTPVKHKTPVVTYRAMPLSELGGNTNDIINLVAYVFNLNDKLVAILNEKITDSGEAKESVDYSSYDFGKFLSTYLTYFSTVESDGAASWTIALNGQFLCDLLGMQVSSPTVHINGVYTEDEKGDRAYIVQGLAIEKTTIKFLDSVNITMTVSGEFDYCNPRLDMRDGYVDETVDLSVYMNKTVNVTYASDIEYAGVDYISGENSLYNIDGYAYNYFEANADLPVVAAKNNGYCLLGWFAKTDNGYNFAKDIEGLLVLYLDAGVGESSIDVTLYAVWAEYQINLSEVKCSTVGWISKKPTGTWSFNGTYSVAFVGSMSNNISDSAGISCNISVAYFMNGTNTMGKEFNDDNIGDSSYSDMSGTFNKSGMNCGNGFNGSGLYGYAKMSVEFICSGTVIASISDIQTDNTNWSY